MSILTELLARVQAAEGPSRDIDFEIRNSIDQTNPMVGVWRYSTSLDALAALAERVLPGWRVTVLDMGDCWVSFYIMELPGEPFEKAIGKGPTEPLARLAAILAAKIAMEGT